MLEDAEDTHSESDVRGFSKNVDGWLLGLEEGCIDGVSEGISDGWLEGLNKGCMLGRFVGWFDG